MAKRTKPSAKKKSAKQRPAKKTPSKKKKAAAKAKSISWGDAPLPPAQRKKALKELSKHASGPSHPTPGTGPAFELDFAAPLPTKKTKKLKRKKR
jgi:hypothetical protein